MHLAPPRVGVLCAMILVVSTVVSMRTNAQTPFTYVGIESQIATKKSESGTFVAGEHFTTGQLIHQKSRWTGLFAECGRGNFWGECALGWSFQLAEGLLFIPAAAISIREPDGLRGRFNLYYDSIESGSFIYTDVGIGKNGNWITVDAVRMLWKHVGLGAALQMPGAGIGPKVELRAGDHVGLWVAPVYEWNEKTTSLLVGGRLTFER